MTRSEMERELIRMVRHMEAFVRMYDPAVNYISVYALDGDVGVKASHAEGRPGNRTEKEVLKGHEFADGKVLIDGVYYDGEGKKIARATA